MPTLSYFFCSLPLVILLPSPWLANRIERDGKEHESKVSPHAMVVRFNPQQPQVSHILHRQSFHFYFISSQMLFYVLKLLLKEMAAVFA